MVASTAEHGKALLRLFIMICPRRPVTRCPILRNASCCVLIVKLTRESSEDDQLRPKCEVDLKH